MGFEIPSELAFDSPTVCVELNKAWVGYLIGAIDRKLNHDFAWDGTEAEIFAARQEVEKIIRALAIGNSIMIGDVKLFAGTITDAKWLICNGTLLTIASYPELYAVIGDSFAPITPPSGQFFLPEMRGRVPVGAGAGSGLTARTLGQKFGEEAHILTTPELAVHTHSIANHNHSLTQTAHSHTTSTSPHRHDIPARDTAAVFGSNLLGAVSNATSNLTKQTDEAFSTTTVNAASVVISVNDASLSPANAGSSNPHNNMQPSTVLNYYIRVK